MFRPIYACLCATQLVALLGACADLIVTDIHHEPWLATQRQIKTTVKNAGLRGAPASTTRIEVKPANAPLRQATASTPALAPNQEIEFLISPLQSSEIPAAGSGQCLELKVCADSPDTVSEGWIWEGNNCRTRSYCN